MHLYSALPRAIAAMLLALTVASCAATMKAPTAPPADATQSALRSALTSGVATPSQPDRVLAFYQARGFLPAWTGGKDQEGAAAAVRAVLAKAHEQGLRDEEYRVALAMPSAPGSQAAAYEIKFTDAVLRYARDVHSGRVAPGAVYEDVLLPSVDFDPVAAVGEAAKNDALPSLLSSLPPSRPEYRGLAQALAKYRAIAAKGGWPTLEGTNEIKLDGKDPRLDALIARLSFEDDTLAGIAKPNEPQLRDAVKRYQGRNGLDQDGRVKDETLAALNVPAAVREREIAANMERWRWLPANFESRYVAVNVPDQSVSYVHDGEVVLRSKVIVGRKTSPTPIARTEIVAVVVNPPWDIPGDIAARDLLPRLIRNPNYLATRRMVVTDGPKNDPYGRTIAWKKIVPAEFPYAIQQLPGPKTALGSLMLDSPNDFDVYLHDTPGKKWFQSPDREISNGCVRVQDIFPLASLALTGDADDGMGRLNKIVASRKTDRIALDNPLPVYFLYWTATANADGSVDFRPDRYGRDAALIPALANGGRAAMPKMMQSDGAPKMDDEEDIAP